MSKVRSRQITMGIPSPGRPFGRQIIRGWVLVDKEGHPIPDYDKPHMTLISGEGSSGLFLIDLVVGAWDKLEQQLNKCQ